MWCWTTHCDYPLPPWSTFCFTLDDSSPTISYNGGQIDKMHFLPHHHHHRSFTLTTLFGLKRQMIIGTKIQKFMSGMQLQQTNGKLLLYRQVGEILPLPQINWHHDNDDRLPSNQKSQTMICFLNSFSNLMFLSFDLFSYLVLLTF